ncbi:hypothetical protein H6G33_00540 [Calothrix sp. FACHB-1219]|uniref:hypothetical protein n=1 Tax=unclassified Calothrix TaxID=2619626 RepID=UPI001687E787|nr:MULTISPECIES: hypothetical protein [unclassified Calothrix]MBD2201089.1 hypothetical protein [Calothrix sp. FACHB-168]MBD2215522.1 hypothetical protein [Calothrix sp. FACHB-1219]
MSNQLGKQLIYAIRDAINNIRYSKRILVVRQRDHQSTYNDYFLYWVSQNVPEAAHLFEVHYLPCEINNWERYALFLPWLQDPLKERFPHIYKYAKELEAQCHLHNIPIVNPVDNLSNSIKSIASKLIGDVGIRTAKTIPITDIEDFKKTKGGLSTPFFIREDWIHGSQIFFIQHPEEIENVSFEKFIAPIAVEFLDVKGEDGLYRKYRYFAMGDEGIPGPLMVSKSWEVRDNDDRVINEAIIAEEIAYFSGEDPNHYILQKARKALGFDFMAFDYSYDNQGNLMVWEPNPFPVIWGSHDSEPNKKYQLPSMDRIYTALLKYYLQRANISIKIPAIPWL